MRKFMTIIFSAMIAIALSAPAWAQTTPATQTKPATVTKTEKKDANAKAKAEKKAKKNTKKNAATTNKK